MHVEPSLPAPAGPGEQVRWTKLLTRYHWFVLVVAALGWLFDTMDQQLFNLARVPAMKELVTTKDMEPAFARAEVSKFAGYATTIFLIGWATGGIIFGILGDRIGRARTMLLTILIYSIFTGTSAMSVGFWDFAIYRFLTGLGVGGEFAVGVALVAEVMPDRARPFALGLLQSLSAIGNITAAIIGIVLGKLEETGAVGSAWRIMFVIGTFPALLAILIRRRLKEPEQWVQLKAQHDAGTQKLGSLTELFGDPRWRKRALVGLALASAGVIGLWGIGFFSLDLTRSVFRKTFEEELRVQGEASQDLAFVRLVLDKGIQFAGKTNLDAKGLQERQAWETLLKKIPADDLFNFGPKTQDVQLLAKSAQKLLAEVNAVRAAQGVFLVQPQQPDLVKAHKTLQEEVDRHLPITLANVLWTVERQVLAGKKSPEEAAKTRQRLADLIQEESKKHTHDYTEVLKKDLGGNSAEQQKILDRLRKEGVSDAWTNEYMYLEHLTIRARTLNGRLSLWAGITSVMINIGGFLGIYAFSRFTHLMGRKPAFAISFVLALLSTAATFWFLNTPSDVFWMIPIMGFCQLSLFGGYAIYFPELFPTRLRSTGISFCYNVGRYVAAVGPSLLGLLTSQVFTEAKGYEEPMRYAGIVMCSVFLIGLAVLPFAPETKGQPLPE